MGWWKSRRLRFLASSVVALFARLRLVAADEYARGNRVPVGAVLQ